jgi:hypothetical protein
MSSDDLCSAEARAYAAAYAAHYSERDLAGALQLYRELIASHAGTAEARYSRTQIQNIVHALVPPHELLEAQLELALARLKRP